MFDTTTYIYIFKPRYIYIKMYNLKNVCKLNMHELSASRSRNVALDLPDSTVDKNPPANPGDID